LIPLEISEISASNIFSNLPSWNSFGITAGFTVLIFPMVKPFEVPGPVVVKKFSDWEVRVTALFDPLEKLQFKVPETAKAKPIVPKPNNSSSAEDDGFPEGAELATEE
jgi:hypothetical protein